MRELGSGALRTMGSLVGDDRGPAAGDAGGCAAGEAQAGGWRPLRAFTRDLASLYQLLAQTVHHVLRGTAGSLTLGEVRGTIAG